MSNSTFWPVRAVALVALLCVFCPVAGAYEVTLTELASGSYIYLSYSDWLTNESAESEAFGGASLSVSLTHTDGSIYTSTRSLTPTITRTRAGDLVTTVLSMNIFGTFTGVSANESCFPSEAIGGAHFWDGQQNDAVAYYSFRITSERNSPPVSDSGYVSMIDSTFGWLNPRAGRWFDVYRVGDDGLWYTKFGWSNGWPTLSGASTFEMGRDYIIYAGVDSAEYASGIYGNFAHGTDTTVSIAFSEFVPVTVPEPSTWALLLGGGLLLVAHRRLRR